MFVDRARAEESEDGQEDYDSYESGDGMSMTSENIDENFEKSMLSLSNKLMMPGKAYIEQDGNKNQPFSNF